MLKAILRKSMDRAYALRSMRLTFGLEHAEPHSIAVRPATPTQNREVLLKLLNLELQAHPPKSGILTVTLEAEATAPQTAQRGLFQAQFRNPTGWSCRCPGYAPSLARTTCVRRYSGPAIAATTSCALAVSSGSHFRRSLQRLLSKSK